MKDETANLLLFLGHLHPLLVHLPIGVLVLLGFLEFVACFKRWREAAHGSRWILGFALGATCAATVCGWMLARTGGYDPELLKWHRVLGLAVAAACLNTFALRHQECLHAYRVSLVLTLVLLGAASHLGGSITHGRGFLTWPVARLLGGLASERRVPPDQFPDPRGSIQQPVFTGVIQPILRDRCASCHGAEKHKSDLRLDTLEGLQLGGRDGQAIKPGRAIDSPLIQRLLLPLEADGHMPPDGSPQPTAAEIGLLEWWVNAGAPVAETVLDLNPEPGIRRLLEAVSNQPGSEP